MFWVLGFSIIIIISILASQILSYKHVYMYTEQKEKPLELTPKNTEKLATE